MSYTLAKNSGDRVFTKAELSALSFRLLSVSRSRAFTCAVATSRTSTYDVGKFMTVFPKMTSRRKTADALVCALVRQGPKTTTGLIATQS